jgi:hypothetical protein
MGSAPYATASLIAGNHFCRTRFEIALQSPRPATQNDNAVNTRKFRTKKGTLRTPIAEVLAFVTLFNLCIGGYSRSVFGNWDKQERMPSGPARNRSADRSQARVPY